MFLVRFRYSHYYVSAVYAALGLVLIWPSKQFELETSGTNLRGLLISTVAVSLHYVPRCLRSTAMSELQSASSSLHMTPELEQ